MLTQNSVYSVMFDCSFNFNLLEC